MSPSTLTESAATAFGPFLLLPAERLLLEDGHPVEIGSRAIEILIALVRHAGNLVSKDELIATAWPNTRVEEVNLRVHVSLLRRALRDGQEDRRYLVTVPGRGYRFVGQASLVGIDRASRPDPAPLPACSLPAAVPRLIGREEIVKTILAQLPRRRLVTLVGPGGIGKTAITVAVAQTLRPCYPDGVCFVDFSSVSQDHMVAGKVAGALGLSVYSNDAGLGATAFLHAKRMLLVLDCCDQVTDGVAAFVEHALKAAAGIHILSTGREPLRAEGERVVRLPPLEMPPIMAGLGAFEILQYPAVQLFVERASAALDGFNLDDRNAHVVAEICTRLDGIALAIELVAGHVATFDLKELAALLTDRFRLLARGRRGAMPRHETMHAALDWSYGTIREPERVLLRRLAVFDGAVTLLAVRKVVSGPDLGIGDIAACLANLVDKSLVTADFDRRQVRYRLLDTTRAYALERLAESGEQALVSRRHAEHYLAAFTRAQTGWAAQTSEDWLHIHGKEIGNARAALDWSFSSDGDVHLGIALAAAALPVMFELSLAEECRRRAGHALAALKSSQSVDRRLELRLRTTIAAAEMYSLGPVFQTKQDWHRVLDIAIELQDRSSEARAVWGLWTASAYGGRAHEALPYARQYHQLSEQLNDTGMILLGERIVAIAECNLGRLEAAHNRLQTMLARYDAQTHRWQTLGFLIDHGAMARATLARVLWLQGRPEAGSALAQQVLAKVQAQGHAISQCYVLTEAVLPLAFMLQDREAIERGLGLLGDLADQNGLVIWKASVRVMRLAARLIAGAPVEPSALWESLTDLSATGYEAHHAWLCGVIAERLGARGDDSAAPGFIDAALARCDSTGEAWIVPELLRVKASLRANSPVPGDEPRRISARAFALAAEQGALLWQSRIAGPL